MSSSSKSSSGSDSMSDSDSDLSGSSSMRLVFYITHSTFPKEFKHIEHILTYP